MPYRWNRHVSKCAAFTLKPNCLCFHFVSNALQFHCLASWVGKHLQANRQIQTTSDFGDLLVLYTCLWPISCSNIKQPSATSRQMVREHILVTGFTRQSPSSLTYKTHIYQSRKFKRKSFMFIQKQAVPLAHTDLHFAAQKWKTLQKIRTYILLPILYNRTCVSSLLNM